MRDSFVHVGLARLRENAPVVVSWALGAVIALEIGRITLGLFGGTPHPVSGAPVNPQGEGVRRSPLNVQSIVAAHVFGVAAPDPALDASSAPQSSANMSLAGTIATSDPSHGIAIITEEGLSKVFAVGNAVGGASLQSVYRDHVILNREGAPETLSLPRQVVQNLRAPVVRTAQNTAPDQSRTLPEIVRVGSTQNDPDGNTHGVHVYPGKSRAAFARTGLAGGDLVVAVNGVPLSTPDLKIRQAAMNAMKTASQATFTVEREGQTQDVSLDATQAY